MTDGPCDGRVVGGVGRVCGNCGAAKRVDGGLAGTYRGIVDAERSGGVGGLTD